MSLTTLKKRLQHFPSLVWLYLVGTFVTRGTYYMVMPFLAVILHQKFQLSASYIGLILSGSVISSTFVGFYVGNLSDRFGRRTILLISGFLGISAFTILAYAEVIWLYVVAITLSAMSRALWEPTSKALIGDLLPRRPSRELALQLSYFVTNAGSAIGPLLGIWLGLTAQNETFLITAMAYFLLTITLFWGFNLNSDMLKRQNISEHDFKNTVKFLLQDHLFLTLIVANILIMFVYSHCDSSLIQYLTKANAPQLLELITALILTNAVTIVTFQFPLLALLRKQKVNHRIYYGLVLLFVSQLIFAFNPINNYTGWILAMFVLSLGEAILFPSMNIQIDQLAPSHLRGSYFGATSFYSFGYASAPLIGGVIIDSFSGALLYQLTSACIFAVILLYIVSAKMKRPNMNEALT